MTQRILCLFLGVGLVSPTLAQITSQDPGKGQKADASADLTDALEILKKADAATKKVKAVKYKARSEATGVVAGPFPKVQGSVGLTSWRKLASSRVAKNAATSPIAMPSPVINRPWRTTMRTTSELSAPRARRIPISSVRWATPWDITP